MSAIAPSTPSYADRLGDVQVGLRPELDFSRHLFRGEVSYIVRDPITFQSHRLDVDDYVVLTELHEDTKLGTAFRTLVEKGELEESDEDRFYEFILSLHQLGFLNLPISDGDRLYRRFAAKRAARRKQRWMSIFFFPAPLWNPDAFLERTIPVARALYSRTALVLWSLLQVLALVAVTANWHRFKAQFGGFFQVENLAVLWGTMIALKVVHEFGHAYACKRFGGHVPEMGVYFILLTPCAYVDATSAWSLTRRWQRLVVNFGGMYFELTIAAIAAVFWCMTPPRLASSVLHNIVLLA
ncbi:MAG: site-2 protease family protein, partial [Planctomycetes bacterium]|nr:site-2 protease family protein [Planctomycetota bacterium]